MLGLLAAEEDRLIVAIPRVACALEAYRYTGRRSCLPGNYSHEGEHNREKETRQIWWDLDVR